MRITYSTDLLRQMWSPDQRPSRMLRKTLFNVRIWCLPAALSRGASSSSTQPDDFLDRSPPPASSPDLSQNYSPISNISFLSKTLERLVPLQLFPYIEKSGLLPPSRAYFNSLNGGTNVPPLSGFVPPLKCVPPPILCGGLSLNL